MLIAENLWKTYSGTDVVRGVSCRIEAGEILGYLGPNGAGKTTTVGMLYGAVIPTRGSVRFGSYDMQKHGREARFSMGIVTQDDNLDPDFDVVSNLATFAGHYGIWGKKARARAEELVERVGLQEHRKHVPEELSGGLRRRLVLARALINKPSLVFLDEPTTGLDPDSRQAFWKLVSELRAEGCAIILTTHYMDEAQRLSDRLLLMQQGVLVDEGTPAELIERVVGSEVIEVEGLASEVVSKIAEESGAWHRAFGTGHLMTLKPENRHHTLETMDKLGPSSMTVRSANLEDVFLRLTGDALD